MPFDPHVPVRPQPKPIKRSTEKRKREVALNANTSAVRAAVFDRDDYTCRILPGCEGAGVNLELVHLEDKGMGGDHGLRTKQELCVVGCNKHHQGARSLHSGHIKFRYLTDRKADGPIAWEYHEAIGQFTTQGVNDEESSTIGGQ